MYFCLSLSLHVRLFFVVVLLLVLVLALEFVSVSILVFVFCVCVGELGDRRNLRDEAGLQTWRSLGFMNLPTDLNSFAPCPSRHLVAAAAFFLFFRGRVLSNTRNRPHTPNHVLCQSMTTAKIVAACCACLGKPLSVHVCLHSPPGTAAQTSARA